MYKLCPHIWFKFAVTLGILTCVGITTLLPFASLPVKAAQVATPACVNDGSNCNFQGPDASGCIYNGATALNSQVIYDQYHSEMATMTLWYSSVCGTNWGMLNFDVGSTRFAGCLDVNKNQSIMTCIVSLSLYGTFRGEPVMYTNYLGGEGVGNQISANARTKMLWSPSDPVKLCGTVTVIMSNMAFNSNQGNCINQS